MESLKGLSLRRSCVPGMRVRHEPALSTGVVVTVLKKPPRHARVGGAFVEDAKQDDTVRRAFDSAGFATVAGAPPRP
jgi:hypothetical protein